MTFNSESAYSELIWWERCLKFACPRGHIPETEAVRSMRGVILQGIGGFYTVRGEGGESCVCKARGRFRKDGIKPMVGDWVLCQPGAGEEDGLIEEIEPRKNACLRPPVANVDQLVLVIASVPAPDLLLVDRLLVSARRAGIDCALCVNKSDLPDGLPGRIAREYGGAYPVLRTSVAENQGLDELRALLAGKTSALAGQSGVGKSSLLNELLPQYLEIGSISERTERGKHTTRRAELLELPQGGRVADTPGFSLLELPTCDPDELRGSYPELVPFEGQCRFLGCRHLKEPGCAARAAAASGAIPPERLERYAVLFQELDEKWKKKYQVRGGT